MKEALLLVFITIFTLVFCREYLTDEQAWKKFQKDFDKHYTSDKEYEARKTIFFKNYEQIVAHNKLYDEGKSTFEMGVNQFSDWTKEELDKLHGFGSRPHGINPDP